jgi:predicted ATP-grasp superfamily ATP-dependent carboligase
MPGKPRPFHVHFGIGIGRTDWHPMIRSRIDLRDFAPSYGAFDGLDPASFDALVPLGLADYEQLRDQPGIASKVIMPSTELVKLCDDKRAFDRHLEDLGFGDLRPGEPGQSFPYVAKASHGHSGMAAHVVQTPDQEAELAEFLARPDVFRQRWLPAQDEYAAHFLVVAGQVHFQTTVRHEMPGPRLVKGSYAMGPQRSRYMPDPYLARFASLLHALGYEGAACIDYKVEAGKPRIMELNPRIGGSLLRRINDYLDAYLAALGLRAPRSPWAQWLTGHRRGWQRRLRRWTV